MGFFLCPHHIVDGSPQNERHKSKTEAARSLRTQLLKSCSVMFAVSSWVCRSALFRMGDYTGCAYQEARAIGVHVEVACMSDIPVPVVGISRLLVSDVLGSSERSPLLCKY